ncbi:MAG: LLM class flavin-dependent oxidoreductase [Dehalococcoidia bacterium]|nr:LLM class flavin-dependent oxidoreductase [Dehalococcoidia bacterium]
MDVGIQLVFASHGWQGVSDRQVYDEELRLALLAEELGFDVAWAVEHHFFDYSFCPDNTELLAYLAAKTGRMDLGTAAVIMPWNHPLRVAEKISLLDYLSGGRLRFGMGRGLSRREYAAFEGIDMGESRERFDESAAMVVRALETGFIEGEGPYYPQPRIEIRPRPERSFKDRLYAVAGSPDSIDSAARLGAAMVMFADRPWETRMPSIEHHREQYREIHGAEAPPPMTADFLFCHPDADYAKEAGTRYLSAYLDSIVEHYEVMGDHFANTKGYDAYAEGAEKLKSAGTSGMLKGFQKATASGTPDQILETLSARKELMGSFELASSFRFGGIPYEEAEASLRLFAKEVLPVIKTWD